MDFPWNTHRDLRNVAGEPVLVRVDFNVPLSEEGEVTETRRLRAALPTIRYLIQRNCRTVLMSHLGRPDGERRRDLSLKPMVPLLREKLASDVQFAPDCIGPEAERMVNNLNPGEVGLLENLRFHSGERLNSEEFASALASLGQAYVNDAFGTSHRDHASITGVPGSLSSSVAGQLLKKEYQVLTKVRDNPNRPCITIMGGVKVSDKLPIIQRFLDLADQVLIAGALAHTFFLAQGMAVGDSLVDRTLTDKAETLLRSAEDHDCQLVLPGDVRVDETQTGKVSTVPTENIPPGGKVKDIGPETIANFKARLKNARTVFWNGPLGVFEQSKFATGTREIIECLEDHQGQVVIGGGESAAAVARFSSDDRFHHVSTGGGAALTLMEGRSLPGYEALDRVDD